VQDASCPRKGPRPPAPSSYPLFVDPLSPVMRTRHTKEAVLNLEQQKKQARELLLAIRSGNADAVSRLRRHHARWATSDEGALRQLVSLHDAQFVLARETRVRQLAQTEGLRRAVFALALHTIVRRGCSLDYRPRSPCSSPTRICRSGSGAALRSTSSIRPRSMAKAAKDTPTMPPSPRNLKPQLNITKEKKKQNVNRPIHDSAGQPQT